LKNLLNTESVLSRINELKIAGYDRIHLPGGTSKDGSYYSGAIVATFDPTTKEVYFLGVPYSSSFHNIGENGHNKKMGEFPEHTVIRELLEETGLQAVASDLKLVLNKKIPDNRPGRTGQFHQKFFYLITEFTGNLFTFEGANPIDGETAAPIWIPASVFVKVLFGGHLEAVNKAIEELSLINIDYAYALMNLSR
jgi:ADP-ribose pyrophosphatase YjhB (NUDIX family)